MMLVMATLVEAFAAFVDEGEVGVENLGVVGGDFEVAGVWRDDGDFAEVLSSPR